MNLKKNLNIIRYYQRKASKFRKRKTNLIQKMLVKNKKLTRNSILINLYGIKRPQINSKDLKNIKLKVMMIRKMRIFRAAKIKNQKGQKLKQIMMKRLKEIRNSTRINILLISSYSKRKLFFLNNKSQIRMKLCYNLGISNKKMLNSLMSFRRNNNFTRFYQMKMSRCLEKKTKMSSLSNKLQKWHRK